MCKKTGRDSRSTLSQRKMTNGSNLGLRQAPRPSWRDFLPPNQSVDARERWRAAFGALLGVLFTAWLCQPLAPAHGSTPWLAAPIGASAVLVFALPASPFAQP